MGNEDFHKVARGLRAGTVWVNCHTCTVLCPVEDYRPMDSIGFVAVPDSSSPCACCRACFVASFWRVWRRRSKAESCSSLLHCNFSAMRTPSPNGSLRPRKPIGWSTPNVGCSRYSRIWSQLRQPWVAHTKLRRCSERSTVCSRRNTDHATEMLSENGSRPESRLGRDALD